MIDGEIEGDDTVTTVGRGESLHVTTRFIVRYIVPNEAVASGGFNLLNHGMVDGEMEGDDTVTTVGSGESLREFTGFIVRYIVPSKAVACSFSKFGKLRFVNGQCQHHDAVAAAIANNGVSVFGGSGNWFRNIKAVVMVGIAQTDFIGDVVDHFRANCQVQRNGGVAAGNGGEFLGVGAGLRFIEPVLVVGFAFANLCVDVYGHRGIDGQMENVGVGAAVFIFSVLRIVAAACVREYLFADSPFIGAFAGCIGGFKVHAVLDGDVQVDDAVAAVGGRQNPVGICAFVEGLVIPCVGTAPFNA